MSVHKLRLSLILPLLFAVIGCRPVRPDDMSAERHRAEAAREEARAAERRQHYDPKAHAVMSPGGGVLAGNDIYVDYNPTDKYLLSARRHEQHARAHEKAAAELQSFEEAECHAFRPAVRAACPTLGPVERVEVVSDGVRYHLAADVDVEAVAAHMRCHLAYARTRGFPEGADCPLYLKGVEIRMVDAHAIDLISADHGVAAEIQRRSR